MPVDLYRIDRAGDVHHAATLDLVHPHGTAVRYHEPFEWPLEPAMADGWFDGLPYPMQDMRPQGFLGRHFARHHAAMLRVSEDPNAWSDDDVLHALSLLGSDVPGNLLVGDVACRLWLNHVQQVRAGEATQAVEDDAVEATYPTLAAQALTHGVAGSSAGGEFPKFTALRRRPDGRLQPVLVKFSGSDDAPGTRRWSDLLVAEHLAGLTVREHLGLPAAEARIHQAGGRTFLEVDRFDRHGALGRSPVVSWFTLNASLVSGAGGPWAHSVKALQPAGWIGETALRRVHTLWLFGQLIANTDMHDGNLSFEPDNTPGDRPRLRMAPVYDMLPMAYAPVRGVELPVRTYTPALPLPSESGEWVVAAAAAIAFWSQAAADGRISDDFRRTCETNAALLQRVAR